MKVAALDFGSNTFLLLIAEVRDERITKIYADETETVRLAQGVDKNKRLHPDALKRAAACLERYEKVIREHAPERIAAVATSAARDAENKEEFTTLCGRYGIPLYVIDGATEARLTFSGSIYDQPPGKKFLVIDVGGGSTEIIGENDQLENDHPESDHAPIIGRSVNVGSVRLTERLLPQAPSSPKELAHLRAVIREEFEKVRDFLPTNKAAQVIAVAGTPVTLALLEHQSAYNDELVHGHDLSLEKITWWCEHLSRMSIPERQSLPGMPASRADVLVAGSAILEGALKILGQGSLRVSTKGVRYGVAIALEKGPIF